MNQYRKLGKNIILLMLGNFGSKLLLFLLVPFYTSILTTVQYGTVDLFVTTINFIAPLFTLLIGETVLRYVLEKDSNKAEVFTIGFTTIVIGAGFVVALSPIIRFNVSLKNFQLLFVTYYFVSQIYILLSQFAKGLERIKIYVFGGLVHTILIIVFNIWFLVILHRKIDGYLISMILSSLLTDLILVINLGINRYLVNPIRIRRELWREMYLYSLPLVPNSICWWFTNFSARYILLYFCGMGATGIYSVAYKIPTILSILSSVFLGAWQISAVEDYGSENSRRFYSNVYNRYSSCHLIVCTVLIILARPMSKVLFAKEFYVAWKISTVLVMAYIFSAMAGFLGTIYTSAKKTKDVYYSTMLAAVINVVANMVLIPISGLLGSAIATLCGYVSIWIYRLLSSQKYMVLSIRIKKDILFYILLLVQIVLVYSERREFYLCAIFLMVFIISFEIINLFPNGRGRILFVRNQK